MTAQANDNKILFTSEEAAEMLSISTKTLREFVKNGDIAYVPLGRGKERPRLGFHRDDINDFIKGRRTRDCLSTNPKTARTTTSTSKLEVYDFMALLKQETAAKQKRAKK